MSLAQYWYISFAYFSPETTGLQVIEFCIGYSNCVDMTRFHFYSDVKACYVAGHLSLMQSLPRSVKYSIQSIWGYNSNINHHWSTRNNCWIYSRHATVLAKNLWLGTCKDAPGVPFFLDAQPQRCEPIVRSCDAGHCCRPAYLPTWNCLGGYRISSELIVRQTNWLIFYGFMPYAYLHDLPQKLWAHIILPSLSKGWVMEFNDICPFK